MTPDKDQGKEVGTDIPKSKVFNNFEDAYESFKPIVGSVYETFISIENKPVQTEITIYRPLTRTWIDRQEGGKIYKIEDDGIKQQFVDHYLNDKQEMIFLLTDIRETDGMTKIKIAGSRFDSHQMLMGSMYEAGVDHDSLIRIIQNGIDLSGGLDNQLAYCGALITPDSSLLKYDSFCDINAYMNIPFKERRLMKEIFERMHLIRESLMRTMSECTTILDIRGLKNPKYGLSIKDIPTRKMIIVD